MVKEREVKQHNFKLETETVEAFRSYCEDNGISQAEGFKLLLNAAELQKAKSVVSDRKAEIEIIETHVHANTEKYNDVGGNKWIIAWKL